MQPQRYFYGKEVLFPDLVWSLSYIINYTNVLVVWFNEVARKPEDKIDLELLRGEPKGWLGITWPKEYGGLGGNTRTGSFLAVRSLHGITFCSFNRAMSSQL